MQNANILKIWGFVIDAINIKDIRFKNISSSQLIFSEKETEKNYQFLGRLICNYIPFPQFLFYRIRFIIEIYYGFR